MRTLNPEMAMANRNNRQTTIWTWRDLDGDRDYDTGGLLPSDRIGFPFYCRRYQYDPQPRRGTPISDEFAVSYERQLTVHGPPGDRDLRMQLNLRRLLEVNRPPSAYNIPVTNLDPAPDGSPRTSDDPVPRLPITSIRAR